MTNTIKQSILMALFLCLIGCSSSSDPAPSNTAPTISDQTFTVNENANIRTIIGTVAASDPEGDTLTFIITDGNANDVFSLDNSSGQLMLNGTLDFETSGSYSVAVQVSDGTNEASATVQVDVIASESIVNGTLPILSSILDGTLTGADYWSEEAKILSAGVGFSDIVGIPADALTEDLVQQAGGAWLTDISCNADDTGLFTSTSLLSQVDGTYILKTPYGALKDGAIGLDGLPIVFSWPVVTSTINLTDFQFTLNTGEVVMPLAAGSWPNWENSERNCVVVFAEFSNRLPSTDPEARFPVKCEIVADDTPLMLLGPNNQMVSAVGLEWETNTSPYDPDNGPRLVGAKLNYVGDEPIGEGSNSMVLNQAIPFLPNDEFALYGGGDFRLRMLTSGGFSPDGVRGVLPTDYEKFFRIHVTGQNGETVLIEKANTDYEVLGGTLRVIGLSDLGVPEGNGVEYGDCYAEDRDNYIDIILVGDDAAARNITHLEIPSLEEGYSAFYNPGGPGTTPFSGVAYSSPGPRDLEPVIMALDDPMRVSN